MRIILKIVVAAVFVTLSAGKAVGASYTYCQHNLYPPVTTSPTPENTILDIQKNSRIDSVGIARNLKNKDFYNNLKHKNAIARLIHKYLVRRQPSTSSKKRTPIDQTKLYRVFEGKPIADIEIVANNIIVNPTNSVHKFTNSLHLPTRKTVIRKDLLFKQGDELDPELMVKNNQILRSRNYIYRSEIIVTPADADTTAVNVKVVTSDRWSIGADGNANLSNGETWGGIYDFNFLGTGSKFRYQLSVNLLNDPFFRGSLFEYTNPNLLGKFYRVSLNAGRSFQNTQYRASVNKRLILNDDYEVGIDVLNQETTYNMLYYSPEIWNIRDIMIKYSSADIWAGKSISFDKVGSSIYVMGRYSYINYYGIGYVNPDPLNNIVDEEAINNAIKPEINKNPFFHDGMLYLASAGVYRERFLNTSMIYGYGYNEYVATGYKLEFTGGYLDGQFNSGTYGGMTYSRGLFLSNTGYVKGDFSLGGFYDKDNSRIFRSAIKVRLEYFTKLLTSGKFHFRQFVTLDYTRGINRSEGVDEWIKFTNSSGPRSLPGNNLNMIGRDRMALNTETVVFTPWRPLGFRMAMYGFFDVGFIGKESNFFKDNFYSTIGIGIRMKNDLLIFSAIQFNIYVAFDKHGLMRNIDWVQLSGEQRMRNIRYIPEKPDIIEYR